MERRNGDYMVTSHLPNREQFRSHFTWIAMREGFRGTGPGSLRETLVRLKSHIPDRTPHIWVVSLVLRDDFRNPSE